MKNSNDDFRHSIVSSSISSNDADKLDMLLGSLKKFGKKLTLEEANSLANPYSKSVDRDVKSVLSKHVTGYGRSSVASASSSPSPSPSRTYTSSRTSSSGVYTPSVTTSRSGHSEKGRTSRARTSKTSIPRDSRTDGASGKSLVYIPKRVVDTSYNPDTFSTSSSPSLGAGSSTSSYRRRHVPTSASLSLSTMSLPSSKLADPDPYYGEEASDNKVTITYTGSRLDLGSGLFTPSYSGSNFTSGSMSRTSRRLTEPEPYHGEECSDNKVTITYSTGKGSNR